jgi:hypothetical protein
VARYKIDCCTKDCPNRSGECHSTCERYKTQRAEYDATMAELKKKEDIQKGLQGFLIENIERTNKRLRRKGR